jgi:hypothetical protein
MRGNHQATGGRDSGVIGYRRGQGERGHHNGASGVKHNKEGESNERSQSQDIVDEHDAGVPQEGDLIRNGYERA